MKLGKKILELRKKKGYSQEELGERINVTRQTISNWELGETTPNTEQLKMLSKEFDISIDELLDNDIKDVLVSKTNDTEKIAKKTLNLLRAIFITIVFLIITIFILFYVIKIANHYNGPYREETIHCSIYGEEHSFGIKYQELTGIPTELGGDAYFSNILDLGKYNDAHQIFDVINDYVKKNNGTCYMIENKDINHLVDMYIKEGTLSKKSATVIIKGKTDFNIEVGETFKIEKYNYITNDYELVDQTTDKNCGFNLPAYTVKKDKELEMNQNWSCLYDELPKGIYRIVKDVFFESDIPVTQKDVYYIWTEFEIA